MPDESELVVVATFVNNFDAEIALSALRAAGLDVMIRADDCGGMRPHLWMGGIVLLARAEDAERAREILETPAEPDPRA
jgi:uridine phosphorylase